MSFSSTPDLFDRSDELEIVGVVEVRVVVGDGPLVGVCIGLYDAKASETYVIGLSSASHPRIAHEAVQGLIHAKNLIQNRIDARVIAGSIEARRHVVMFRELGVPA